MQSQHDPVHSQKQGINKLKDTYLHWTRTQLDKLRAHLQLLEQESAYKPDDLLTEIFDLSHNIKGLGGSFGYYLMTDIATSLCEYLRFKDNISDLQTDIITAHVKSMDVVLTEEIGGSGGEQGNQILEQLQKIIDQSSDD
ncbi:MAG: Hpt domain-containing protein [Emcibacter sp.]|nr:Hpt domain-containing protein [Emcibacter sp.]